MDETKLLTPFSPHCRVADRYELLRLIGQGGMGEVWEARHLELDAPVAIKFAIERRLRDETFFARFRREACALARLRFPNIVQIFDVGVHEGFPFMVMELLVGESLKARLDREKRLSAIDTSCIVNQVARALAAIHGAGMVHRDATPGNVFLSEATPQLGETFVKLLDFGIVKDVTADTRMTATGVVIGSPAYMSPEQARAEGVDRRSDLWSLGALIFRAITGRDPFSGGCTTDVLFAICTGEVPSVGPDFSRFTGDLDAFFARAMARNPAHRFEDAVQMAEAFWKIAVASESEALGDCGVSSSCLRSGGGLERLGTTTALVQTSLESRSEKPLTAAIRRHLSLLAVAVLGVGMAVGYVIAVLHRGMPSTEAPAASLPLRPAPLPTTVAAIPVSPALTEAAARNTGPVGAPQVQGGVPPLPTSKRRTTKMSSTPSHAKDAIDPVFGLPVQE